MNSDLRNSEDRRKKVGMFSFFLSLFALSHVPFSFFFPKKEMSSSSLKFYFSNLSLSFKDKAHVVPRVHALSGSVSALKEFISPRFKFKLF